MLTITTGQSARDCSGRTRRDFLRLGAAGVAGMTLPHLLAAKAGASGAAPYIKDKAIVLLFLGGGASQFETFDPKMAAPEEIRSVTGEIPTSLPGVSFGGTFPRLAKLAHKLAIVRSFQHPVGDHGKAIQYVLQGGTAGQMSMGAIYARLRGCNHERTGIPTHCLLNGPETDSQYRTEKQRVIEGSRPGALGAAYAPFTIETELVGGNSTRTSNESESSGTKKNAKPQAARRGDGSGRGNPAMDNLQLSIPRDRLSDRKTLLDSLDRLNRRVDATGMMEGLDKFEAQALELILGSAGQAFDLSKEDPRVIKQYDTSSITIGNHAQRPNDVRPSNLGQQFLLARRLIEAGCGFLTIQSAGWDMHADGNNPNMIDGMRMLGPTMDRAVSVFLEDLERRGLSEKVLLVITGDFGRTPRINKKGGRDHWAKLGTLAFAGGGLKMGQIIGQSDKTGGEPVTEPITPQMLLTTLMHTVFDLGAMRLATELPRDLMGLIQGGTRIKELFA